MTVVEKKIILKKIIDELHGTNLDEALIVVQELASKDKKRKEIVSNLLKTEKSLFEKLAQ